MIPGPEDERPLGRSFREVERKTPADQMPWFMRAKRDYAEGEARRRTIVEEKMEPEHQKGAYAHPMQNVGADFGGDLVAAKVQEMRRELNAIEAIFGHLAPLDGAARKRVFGYVSEMLGEMP